MNLASLENASSESAVSPRVEHGRRLLSHGALLPGYGVCLTNVEAMLSAPQIRK